jgi:thiol-disulfide isomerase/thioredoxin
MVAYNTSLDIFFDEIDMNDTLAQITGEYFFYINGVSNKIPRDRDALFTFVNKEIKEHVAKGLTSDELKAIGDSIFLTKKIKSINELKNGRLRDILFAKLVSEEIGKRNIDNIDKAYHIAKEHIQYEPYLIHLTNYFTHYKQKEAEFENNPITFRNSNNSGEQLFKEIIKENKDKLIILDFWFTGCGACRKDFKNIAPFKKDLSIEADVAFVYLCYGSTEKDWKSVSKEYNLQGQNYLLTQEQQIYFKELFSISSAPRYILINKAGKVVHSNFEPPMNKDQFILKLKNAI